MVEQYRHIGRKFQNCVKCLSGHGRHTVSRVRVQGEDTYAPGGQAAQSSVSPVSGSSYSMVG